jgi:hypothetical protein
VALEEGFVVTILTREAEGTFELSPFVRTSAGTIKT